MPSDPSDITWQEAVALIVRQRPPAENLVGLLKQFGDGAAIAKGSILYADAKAEYDALVAGLIITLARKQQPAGLPGLEGLLRRGYEKREALRKFVEPLIRRSSGQKGIVADIVKGGIGPMVEALKAIYFRHKDDDDILRKTIQTQLEAAKWPTFAQIAAGS